MIKRSIERVAAFNDLTVHEMEKTFTKIMSGKATPAQIASFITALRMKGETVDEITGAAKVMRRKVRKIRTGKEKILLDTCGTGGSGKNIINVSTAVAIILAAAGVRVAKHGNRSMSSKCGSADVLEALGVKINISLKKVEKCLKEIDLGFMFAPLYHKAMKYAAVPRKDIGIRTIFNVLGPLSNPAGASYQIMGVYDAAITEKIAKVLKKLGTEKAYVVHGADGIDEVTVSGRTKISELRNKKVRTFYVTPDDFGIKRSAIKAVKGGTALKNALTIKKVLAGHKGPARDIILVNASLALMLAGKAKGYKSGVKIASEIIDSGKAELKLESFVKITNR